MPLTPGFRCIHLKGRQNHRDCNGAGLVIIVQKYLSTLSINAQRPTSSSFSRTMLVSGTNPTNSKKASELIGTSTCPYPQRYLSSPQILTISYSYIKTQTGATLTIQRSLFNRGFAKISVKFKPDEFGDYEAVDFEGGVIFYPINGLHASVFTDSKHLVSVKFVCGRSRSVSFCLSSETRKFD